MCFGPQLCWEMAQVTEAARPWGCPHATAMHPTYSWCLQDYTTIYSTMKRIADAEPRDLDAWTLSMTLGERALCLTLGQRGGSRNCSFFLPDCSRVPVSLIYLVMLGGPALLCDQGCSRRGARAPGSQ